MPDTTKDEQKVQSPKEVAQEGSANVKATNQGVDKAGEEAAKRVEGQGSEAANTIDSILGADEKHGENVKKAQAATNGVEYDPDTDPELNPPAVTPAPSQNQNNLKHDDSVEANDPNASRNYLGQRI